jgi:hypothetical protein
MSIHRQIYNRISRISRTSRLTPISRDNRISRLGISNSRDSRWISFSSLAFSRSR